jgi:hypothetical protein
MARAGELHEFGVYALLAGAFLPIADIFIVNVAWPTIASSLHACEQIRSQPMFREDGRTDPEHLR